MCVGCDRSSVCCSTIALCKVRMWNLCVIEAHTASAVISCHLPPALCMHACRLLWLTRGWRTKTEGLNFDLTASEVAELEGLKRQGPAGETAIVHSVQAAAAGKKT